MKSFREVMDDLRAGFGDLKVPAEKIQEDIDALIEDFEQGKMTEEEFNAECDRLMEGAYGAEGALKAEAAASLAGKTGLSGLLAIVNASPEDYDNRSSTGNDSNGNISSSTAIRNAVNAAGTADTVRNEVRSIDWMRKLTSRKLWLSVASFVTLLMVALGGTEGQAGQVTAIIMAGASVISYVLAEGWADAANIVPVEGAVDDWQ